MSASERFSVTFTDAGGGWVRWRVVDALTGLSRSSRSSGIGWAHRDVEKAKRAIEADAAAGHRGAA